MVVPDYAIRLVRTLSEAAMFVSAGGRILAANKAARHALRVDSERPAACELTTLVDGPPEKLADTLRAWSRSTDPTPGSFAVMTTTYNAKGCVLFPASEDGVATLLVRFWPRAEGNPFVLLTQKVTELNYEITRRGLVEHALRQSEVALRERASEAEALNRAKDEFLATVSHELRTPLNAILGWSSLLRGRAADPEIGKAIEVIHRNAESQAKLIDDILDVSRIITGKLLIETRPSDLAAIVKDAVDVVRPSAAAKHIEIALLAPSDICVLVADPDRLQQAAWNLLSNAVKFTDRGGNIRVEIERRGSHLCLIVSDSGRGIDAAFLPFVFDRFKQADGTSTRRTGGLGLGLAIVRHVVELHGGTVEAFSEGQGRGATFTVTLPVRAVTPLAVTEDRRSSPGRETPSVPPSRSSDLEGLRILIVDDERDARELLAAVLTRAGASVEAAGSAAEGLRAVATFRPHVLVSDIGMPEEDGFSFMRKLRQLGAADGGAIPSIALTAYTRAEDRTKAVGAGFTTHMGKPVSSDDLVAAVANLAAFAPR